MICPKCLHKKTKVYNSRFTNRQNRVWRRRECLQCHTIFSTHETVVADQLLLVQTPNMKKPIPYSRTKLLLSLAKACDDIEQPHDSAFYLLETIEATLLRSSAELVCTTDQIVKTCLEALQAYDTKAHLKYLTTHANISSRSDLKRLLKK